MPNKPVKTTDESPAEIAALSKNMQLVVDRATATGRYAGENPFLIQALNADSLAEATDIGAVIAGKDHLNERMRYVDVAFLDSDPELDSEVPIYAVCTVIREMGDGVAEKMSIGAAHVVGVLIRAAEMDWFPFDAELVTVPLSAGRKAINLQLAPTKVANQNDF